MSVPQISSVSVSDPGGADENIRPPQHSNNSNYSHRTLDTQVDSAPPPPTVSPPRQYCRCSLLEGESTCKEMDPSPPGPARIPAQGQHAPGTQRHKAHPRPAQEQHSHQASNLCPPAQGPRKHSMQPPDVAP
ncbi:hypothetical protein CRENBAI_010723 [Crenichthys baileyi]|uniref:Uncharacterized protein n=1 Tax=Crenichthys baileyi TaxID=28760 RepID=A0AAV9RRR1_9TELE